jgi:hypothetical protein
MMALYIPGVLAVEKGVVDIPRASEAKEAR